MSKAIPPIQKFMTFNPHMVDGAESIKDALTLMNNQNIRHLPVTRENQLYGIISDRDIRLALCLVQADKNLLCEAICHTDVYSVDPDTPVDVVCEEMAEHHYGCVIIKQNSHIVGIFTTVDACRAVAEISRQKFHQ